MSSTTITRPGHTLTSEQVLWRVTGLGTAELTVSTDGIAFVTGWWSAQQAQRLSGQFEFAEVEHVGTLYRRVMLVRFPQGSNGEMIAACVFDPES